MSLSKLQKYLDKPRPLVIGHRYRVPVLLSDSKGCYLKDHGLDQDHPVERQIDWMCKRGAKVQAGVDWLKQDINRKIRFLGNISLYVWLGTCNLTTRDKSGKIQLRSWNDDTVDEIVQNFKTIINIISEHPNSKVTFLELPIYSIRKYNGDDETFKDQDSELINQIYKLNGHIRDLNESVNSLSPEFSSDLYKNSKYKSGDHRNSKTRNYYNFNLFKDGLHPDKKLSKVWLRKIANVMYRDCWKQ